MNSIYHIRFEVEGFGISAVVIAEDAQHAIAALDEDNIVSCKRIGESNDDSLAPSVICRGSL